MTPRQYLSWSSMDLFERDQKKWVKVYVYGARKTSNRGQRFGKKMADGLETNEMTGDPVLDMVIETIPKFEVMDKVVEDPKGDEVEFVNPTDGTKTKYILPVLKFGKERIPLMIRPDSWKKDGSAFKEYKTGQEKWTKSKVDNSGQITFYAAGFFIKNGKIPQDIELVHVQTEKEDKYALDAKLRATGDIFRHPTQRTMAQVLAMMVRMKKNHELMKKITEKELL